MPDAGVWAAAGADKSSKGKAISLRILVTVYNALRLEKSLSVAHVLRMQQPIQIDLPHKLGREEAQRRIAANIHKLQDFIPGGAQVTSNWAGNRLDMGVGAMGQQVDAQIDVEEQQVRVRVTLPAFLAMLSKPIEAVLRSRGEEILLEDKSNAKN